MRNPQTTHRATKERPGERAFGKAHPSKARQGFTLIELLVVLGIIGVLTAITLPAMKGMRKTNTMVSAGRQLVDDIGLARAKAISERTTVHVIFVPSEILSPAWTFSTVPGADGNRDRQIGDRLRSSPYVGYALFAERTVGDQPGRSQFRYLTSWRSLPEGIFIATNKFLDNIVLWNTATDYQRPFEYIDLPFPTAVGATYRVPHIAFDAQGRLVDKDKRLRFQSEVLPLGRGSIIVFRSPGSVDFDLRESPPGNATDTNNFHRVVVDGLTGRARVETPQIQ
jgi:prepilin-type N-terminal cleavage/methylation domain-containing protein